MKTFSKKCTKALAVMLVAFLIAMVFIPPVKASAITGFTLEIGFADDYDPAQGRVEYKINDADWVSVSAAMVPTAITEEVTSFKFRVVPSEYYEVNFDNGPTVEDAVGFFFGAGGTDAEKAALTSTDGYACTLIRTDGEGDHPATKISLKGVAFRGTTASNAADISIDITGPGLEFWEEDIPSRITFRLPGTEDIAFGKGNLTWAGDQRPPNATGVKTTNPVNVNYDYDNSGEVEFVFCISNANTKITSLEINGTDYTGRFPQTDEQILDNIDAGGRATEPVSVIVPHATSYDVVIVAEEHDLMGGFGWNYLPEENLDGDSREDCIAHGTLSFISGEYNGVKYNSVAEWNNAGDVFNWSDGDKNYTDERDAWGSVAFPKGAKITLKLIPDEGYQLISLYGDQNLFREEELGTYTITMTGGMNSHLMATFKKVDDVVNATAEAVKGGKVSNVENTYGVGTMKLNVENTDINGESRTGFEGKADEEKVAIEDYIDINLANTIYKARDDHNDAWDREVKNLSSDATIELELEKNYEGKELVIIHEHDGQYEILPVEYDGARNTVTFQTRSFSNYAIATKKPEESPENPENPENPEEPKEPEKPSDPGSGDQHYALNGGGNVLEFDDRKGADYSAIILDFNKITDEELAAMGATRAEANEMVNAMKSALPKEFINLYVAMILDNETGEQVWGRQNLVLKIKKTDDMKDYENFRLIDVSEFGEDSFTGEEIKGVEEDGYLVFKLDEIGNFALIADKAKQSDGGSSSTVKTGDESQMGIWWALLISAGIMAMAYADRKRRA